MSNGNSYSYRMPQFGNQASDVYERKVITKSTPQVTDDSAHKPKVLRRLFLGMIAIALVVGLFSVLKGFVLGWLENTPWSKLEKIEVLGLERLSEDFVTSAADIGIGSNLMHLPLDSIAMRLSSLPAIKQARVMRKLPGKLQIVVKERLPIALVVGSEPMLVDKEGALFPVGSSGEVIDLPLLTGKIRLESGKVSSDALSLASEFSDRFSSLYGCVSEISSNEDETTVKLLCGTTEVKIDDIEDAEAWQVLELFLEQHGDRLSGDLSYVDLRYSGKVVTG